MTTTERKKTGPRMPQYPIKEKEGRLPGRILCREKDDLHVTKTTFLPTCSICRCYPAHLVNGIYLCRGQHD